MALAVALALFLVIANVPLLLLGEGWTVYTVALLVMTTSWFPIVLAVGYLLFGRE